MYACQIVSRVSVSPIQLKGLLKRKVRMKLSLNFCMFILFFRQRVFFKLRKRKNHEPNNGNLKKKFSRLWWQWLHYFFHIFPLKKLHRCMYTPSFLFSCNVLVNGSTPPPPWRIFRGCSPLLGPCTAVANWRGGRCDAPSGMVSFVN